MELYEALEELGRKKISKRTVLISVDKDNHAHICNWSVDPSNRLQLSQLVSEAQMIIPQYYHDPVVSAVVSEDTDPARYDIEIHHEG